MFFPEIWIRWGSGFKYDCLRLKELQTGKIRYEHSFQFHKSRKKTYNFVIALQYQEETCWDWNVDRWRRKSSWVFQGRSDKIVQNKFICGKYNKYTMS